MKTHTEYIHMKTHNEKEIVNITGKVEEIIDKSGVKDGMVLLISVPGSRYSTASSTEGAINA